MGSRGDTDASENGDLSGLVGAALVHYVDRALGPAGVKQVMDRVGAHEIVTLVEDWEEWVDLELVLTTAIAVAELCHEPDIGRRTGEELFTVLQERGLLMLPPRTSLTASFGDIVASLNTATDLRHAVVVDCEEGYARIEVTAAPAGRTKFLCRMLLGLYSRVPSLQQSLGAVVETRCIRRGDDGCEFEVRWRSVVPATPTFDPWVDRVHRLQEWAAGLASDDVDHTPAALEAAALLNEIRGKAFIDPLTGIANRSGLELRVHQELERRGTLDALTVLFIDLDGFKPVNDTYGHAVGDELLIQVSRRLGGVLRDLDLVARIGGDEFVVLLAEVPDDVTFERLVRKVLAVFNDPYAVHDDLHQLACSVGVSRAPQHGSTLTELLAHADGAMYRVKKARRAAQPPPPEHLRPPSTPSGSSGSSAGGPSAPTEATPRRDQFELF